MASQSATIPESAILGGLSGLSPWLLVTFLTEVTFNTATATMLMPVLAASAHAAQVHPFLLMNLVGVVVITLLVFLLAGSVFGIESWVPPSWSIAAG